MILDKIKITRLKLFIAKILYKITKLFYKSDKQIVKRDGIVFELDLNEGIDLHLFWFGSFQKHVYKNPLVRISEDATIFDVGGNVGVMSLFFSQKATKGFIHSFEPTTYALTKFRRNMELNPELAKNIKVTQTFISSQSESQTNLTAYSSWPIKSAEKKHDIHCGVAKNTEHIPSITIDDYVTNNNINRLNLIKIDTDGHELSVLQGATNSIRKFKPTIIFEIGIYIMKEHNINFSDYTIYFNSLSYSLYTPSGKNINIDNFEKYIPQFGTIDIIAVPN